MEAVGLSSDPDDLMVCLMQEAYLKGMQEGLKLDDDGHLGLRKIMEASEKSDSRLGGLRLDKLDYLTDEAARILIKNDGDLHLDGISELSDSAAEILSKHRQGLGFGKVIKLSDAAAKSLSMHQGHLSFDGLIELSGAAAKSLSKHRGWLVLRILKKASPKAWEILSTKKDVEIDDYVEDLSKLTTLSDAAAESLSKLQGSLSLNGLAELSDAAAESLSKHQGKIDLSWLIKLSKKSRKILSMNPDIKLPDEEAE